MKIEQNKLVGIYYTLKNSNGEVLDQTEEGSPLVYLHGGGFLIPGLEAKIEGREAGESFDAKIEAEQAYGERDEELIGAYQRDQFPDGLKLEEGAILEVGDEYGQPQLVMISKIDGDEIYLDANHPLAGQDLFFDVTIDSVRQPTPEEMTAMLAEDAGGCGCGCDDDSCAPDGGGCGSGGCQ